MELLKGKRALIVGLANHRSIAYGIGSVFHQYGAELALTYQNDKLKERVEEAASKWQSQLTFPCDVSSDDSIQTMFKDLKQHWDSIDIIIHSVAFAPGELLQGDFTDVTTRAGFNTAHEISSYSFTALAREARHLLNPDSALLTLTYLGAERVAPNYNVMGLAKASLEANVRYLAHSLGPQKIRVNGISAGPVKTLAASGIQSFRKMLKLNERMSPLKANVTPEQIGQAAAFLCSGMASGITGEILHVDCGFNTTAMAGELE